MADLPDDDVEELKSAEARELHQAVREAGEAELERPVASLFWSGLAAGLAIHASLVAEAALYDGLPDAPWRHLVVSIGYPVGFLIVILGRMQLFTESTISAMLPFVARPSRRRLACTVRLWVVVLAANLLGTAAAAGLVAGGAIGGDERRRAMVAISRRIMELDGWGTFVNAVPAGFLIAMIAWILPNARGQAFLVIFALTWLVAAAGFSHSVVGADEAWLLLFTGEIDVARTVFGLIVPGVLGNLVGGAGLFAVLAHAQVRSEGEGE